MTARAELSALLQRDQELREIAGLVGLAALTDSDRLAIEVASILRDVVLRQSAYDPNDVASSPRKTYALAVRCARLFRLASEALEKGRALTAIPIADARIALAEMRDAPDEKFEECAAAFDGILGRCAPSESA
jgi:vacuolar-type H+-ATPase catalytic subunit A/Vma1